MPPGAGGARGRRRPRRTDDGREHGQRAQRRPPRGRARGASSSRRRGTRRARRPRPLAPAAHGCQGALDLARRAVAQASLRELSLWPLLPFQLWHRAARRAAGRQSRHVRPRRGSAASSRAADPPPRAPHGEDLREDRERSLLLRVGADVETARPLIRASCSSETPASSRRPRRRSGCAATPEHRRRTPRCRARLSTRARRTCRRGSGRRPPSGGRARSPRAPPPATSGSERRPTASARVSGTSRARRATIAVQPSSFAARQSDSAVSTAP